jgi:hypothetical protein
MSAKRPKKAAPSPADELVAAQPPAAAEPAADAGDGHTAEAAEATETAEAPADGDRPSRWERRAKGKSEQSFGKVPVRGNVQSTPHRRDYASRRRSGG